MHTYVYLGVRNISFTENYEKINDPLPYYYFYFQDKVLSILKNLDLMENALTKERH